MAGEIIVFCICFVLVIIDMIIFRFLKSRFSHLLLLTLLVIIFIFRMNHYGEAFGREKGYAPEQPLIFSHEVHSGEYRISCLYCHSNYNEASHAGMPSTQACMNCHEVIKKGKDNTGDINKILASVNTGQPIEWIKVYDLPDYVRFNHARHVSTAGISCAECHGDVNEMEQIEQAVTLSMGWCLECHRSRSVELPNEYYRNDLENNIDSILFSRTGGDDCGVCHY